MRTPPPPALAALSPLGRAIWRLVAPADLDSLRPAVAGWLTDQRWAQVEASYAQATAAMARLARIGPRHGALLGRFRRRAPELFLFLCLARRQGDPLSNQRDFMADIARLCAYERDICFGGLTEADCRDLEALVLEGADLDAAGYERDIRKLPAVLRAGAAAAWSRLGVSSPMPKLWCYNRFHLPAAPYNIGRSFACLATKGDRDVCVQVSLRAVALADAAKGHRAPGPSDGEWDPCVHRASDEPDPIHVTMHEMIHAATTREAEVWTGDGGQAQLIEARDRLAEEFTMSVVGIRWSGILPLPITDRYGPTRLLLSEVLEPLNEALTEAATIDLLSLTDPAGSLPSGRTIFYDRGVEFVRELLSNASPRDLLFSPDPVAALVAAIRARMSSDGADFMIDLIFEKSGPFATRGDLPKPLDTSDAASPARVYRLLAGVLTVDDERREATGEFPG